MNEFDIVAAVGNELVREHKQRIFLEVDTTLIPHMKYDFRERFPSLLHDWLRTHFNGTDSMNGWQSLTLKDFSVRLNVDNYVAATQSVRCTTLISMLTPPDVFQVVFIDSMYDFWAQRKPTKDITVFLQHIVRQKRFRVITWLIPRVCHWTNKPLHLKNKTNLTQTIYHNLSAMSCIDSWLTLSPIQNESMSVSIAQGIYDSLLFTNHENIQKMLAERNPANIQEWLDKQTSCQRVRNDIDLDISLIRNMSKILLEIGCLEATWTRNVGILSYGERLCSLLKVFWYLTYLEHCGKRT